MFTAGITVTIWRAPSVQTSHGARPGTPEQVGSEDEWALAPPTPVDNNEPDRSARDMVVDHWTGYREDLPTSIKASDQIRVLGDDSPYEVMGQPGPWSDPWSGQFMGSTMQLRRVNG